MKRMIMLLMTVLAAAGLLLMLGCAELQSGLDNVGQEISKTAESASSSSRQAASTEGEASSSSSSASTVASVSASQPSSSTTDRDKETGSQTSAAETLIHVTLDGQKSYPDAYGIYWVVKNPVSATPEAVFTLDESMGEMHMCILNIYLEEDGREVGQPWAVTDFNITPRLMAPGQPFNLANPGEGVMIISPGGEQVKSCDLESGKSYIAIFAVSASKQSWTQKVRFSVK